MPTNPSPSLSDSAVLAARPAPQADVPRPAAVIDIGTTSIRMAIAEIDAAGAIRPLETLSQAVELGKDTFTRASISKGTIEACVEVLSSYRRVLKQYQIDQPDRIRVVATSAVREADNRLAFLDRIYSATGFEIEPLDEAEVNRITYLGVQPHLKADPALSGARTIIAEVGGGSTEILLVKGADVLYAHTYRLGSLRMRQALESLGTPLSRLRQMMSNPIQRTVAQVVEHLPRDGSIELVALGGDVRFAASKLVPEWDPRSVGRIPVARLEQFTDRMLSLSVDELVLRYHLAYPDAETLGPALLAYVHLARALGLDHVLLTNVNLRDGLLMEMAARGTWSEEFREQIVRAAIDLGRKFDFDEAHARYVAGLCGTLFDQLRDEHRLDPRHRMILHVAALLHEIGHFVNHAEHHKHAMYLILNSELFGLSRRDVLLAALVARYHRRAAPRPTHTGYASLDRERRIAVTKMAALLRVADALDRSYSQRIEEIRCRREGDRLVIEVPRVEDLSLEQLGLRQKGALFEEIFGLQILLRGTPA